MFQYIVVVKLNTSDIAITRAVDTTVTTAVNTTMLPEQYILGPYHGRRYYYITKAVDTTAMHCVLCIIPGQ